MWSQRSLLVILLRYSQPSFWGQGLLANPKLTDLTRLSHELQGPSHFHLLRAGSLGVWPHAWLFMWMVEDQTQVLMIAW